MRPSPRSKYLVELLCHGRFDLNMYASFQHAPLALELPRYYDNVRASVPTALYALWHLYFSGDDVGLAKVLDAAETSPARRFEPTPSPCCEGRSA